MPVIRVDRSECVNLRVSRPTLRRMARSLALFVALLAATAGVYVIGLRITPRTERQRPILYSPAVRAALDYRSRAIA